MPKKCICNLHNKQNFTKILSRDESTQLIAGGTTSSNGNQDKNKTIYEINNSITRCKNDTCTYIANLNIRRSNAGGAGSPDIAYIYGGKTYTALLSTEKLSNNIMQSTSNMNEAKFDSNLEQDDEASFIIKNGFYIDKNGHSKQLDTRSKYDKSTDIWVTHTRCSHSNIPCEYDAISDSCRATHE